MNFPSSPALSRIVLLSLILGALSVPAARAEKGPVWGMKLPVAQRALLVPYAGYALETHDRRVFEDRAFSALLRRSIRNGSESLSLLSRFPERRFPQHAFSFPFYNLAADLEGIAESDFGFCLGFSYTLRRLNVLAEYRPDLPRLPEPKDYFPILDALSDDRPAAIPGYPDLYTFASEPEIARYLKIMIVDEWAKRNVRGDGIRLYLDGLGRLRPAETDRLVRGLRRYLALGVNPIIYFSIDSSALPALLRKVGDRVCELNPAVCESVRAQLAKSLDKHGLAKLVAKTGWIHVVQVYSVRVDGSGRVHALVWDINSPAESASADLVIDPKFGKASFPLRSRISETEQVEVPATVRAAAIHPSESAEIGRMLSGLRRGRAD